jgi:hypothetical protein
MNGIVGFYLVVSGDVPAHAGLHEDGTVAEQLVLKAYASVNGPPLVFHAREFLGL